MSKTCPHCGQSFQTTRNNKKFCSPRCALNAATRRHYAQNKDKHQEYCRRRHERCKSADNANLLLSRRQGIQVYGDVLQRCNNPRSPRYSLYGAKGIQCPLSKDEFLSIYFRTDRCEWCGRMLQDIDRRRSDGRNVHRTDSKGNYVPGNLSIICKGCHAAHHARQRRQQVNSRCLMAG